MRNTDYLSYIKVIQLEDARQFLFRFLNQGDREDFGALIREVTSEELLFLKQDLLDRTILNHWFDQLHYDNVLPLAAVDLNRHRLAAVAILQRGGHTMHHIGNISLLVSQAYRQTALGSLMLEDLIDLAWQEDLHWLSTEVLCEQAQLISAFKAKGFEIKAQLPDYIRHHKGVTKDVVLLMRPMLKQRREF